MLAVEQVRPKHRYWLHAVLLLATFLSTTVVGVGLARGFSKDQSFDYDVHDYAYLWHDPGFLLTGVPFSLTLLIILLTHELGHYFAARYYNVDVTLPFFIPAPTLIGTLGAFIRIRSPILSKRILFDIGVAGPLAGFAALIFPMVLGVARSRMVPGVATHGELIFGAPPILRFVEWMLFPGAASANILLHPIARAAWVGLLATALNLLPIGQLDGGHILYAFLGERSRWFSRIFIAVLVPLGIFFAYSWLVWAVLLFFFGMRHPSIVDPYPLGRVRSWLGFAALVVFVLSFTVSPIRINGL